MILKALNRKIHNIQFEKNIAENCPFPVFIFDNNYLLVWANEEFYKQFMQNKNTTISLYDMDINFLSEKFNREKDAKGILYFKGKQMYSFVSKPTSIAKKNFISCYAIPIKEKDIQAKKVLDV